MKYICSVYSYTSRLSNCSSVSMLHDRYKYISEVTATYLKNNETVFSPIAHCHPIAKKFDMPKTWDFWEFHDKAYIDASSGVIVAKMPFWKLSTGITAEISHAKETGKRVEYHELTEMELVSLSPFINMDLPISPLQQLRLLEFSEFLLTLQPENYGSDESMRELVSNNEELFVDTPYEVHDYMLLKNKNDVIASPIEWVSYFFDRRDDNFSTMLEELFGFNDLTLLDDIYATFFASEWDSLDRDTPLNASNRIIYFLSTGNYIKDFLYDSNSVQESNDMIKKCTNFQKDANNFIDAMEK